MAPLLPTLPLQALRLQIPSGEKKSEESTSDTWGALGLLGRFGDAGKGAGVLGLGGVPIHLKGPLFGNIGGRLWLFGGNESVPYTDGFEGKNIDARILGLGAAPEASLLYCHERRFCLSFLTLSAGAQGAWTHLNNETVDLGWERLIHFHGTAGVRVLVYPSDHLVGMMGIDAVLSYLISGNPDNPMRAVAPPGAILDTQLNRVTPGGFFYVAIGKAGSPPKRGPAEPAPQNPPSPPPQTPPAPEPPKDPEPPRTPVTPPPQPPATLPPPKPPTRPPVTVPPKDPDPPSLAGIERKLTELTGAIDYMIAVCNYVVGNTKIKPPNFPRDLEAAKREFKNYPSGKLATFIRELKEDIQKIHQEAKKYPKSAAWGRVCAQLIDLSTRVQQQQDRLAGQSTLLEKCTEPGRKPPKKQLKPMPPAPPRPSPPTPPTPPPSPPPAAEPPKAPPAPPVKPPAVSPPRKDGCPQVTDRLHGVLTAQKPGGKIVRPSADQIREEMERFGIGREVREHVMTHLKDEIRAELGRKKEALNAVGILPSELVAPSHPNAKENRELGLQVWKLWLKEQQIEYSQWDPNRALPGLKGVDARERFKSLKVNPGDVGIFFRDPVVMRGGPGALFGAAPAALSYCATANPEQEKGAAERMYNSLLGQNAEYDHAEEELDQDLKGEALDEAFYELLPFVDAKVLATAIRRAFEDCGDVPPEGYELVAQMISQDAKNFQTEKRNKRFKQIAGLYLFSYAFPPAGAVGKMVSWGLRAATVGSERRQAISDLRRARTYNEIGILSDKAAKDKEAEAAVGVLTQLFPGGNFGVGSILRAGMSQGVMTEVAYHMVDHPEADEAAVFMNGASRGIGNVIAAGLLGGLGAALRGVRPGDSINLVGVLVPRGGNRGGLILQIRDQNGGIRETRRLPGTVTAGRDGANGNSLTVIPDGGRAIQVPVPRGSQVVPIPRGCDRPAPPAPAPAPGGGGRGGRGGSPTPAAAAPAPAPAPPSRPPQRGVVTRPNQPTAPASRPPAQRGVATRPTPPAPAPPPATPPGPRPFKMFASGSYGDLKRAYANGGGAAQFGATHMDHLPSQAARIRALEIQRGRRFTPAQRRIAAARIRETGVAIAIPARLHREMSRTYGGRNNPLQIQRDAANLGATFERDAQALLEGARRLRFSPAQTQNLRDAIDEARRRNMSEGIFR